MPLNKDTGDELDRILDDFGSKYEWPYEYMHDRDRSPADQQQEARKELRTEAKAALHRLILKERREERDFLGRLKLEFDANRAQYEGEPWSDSDAAQMVEGRIAQIDSELERSSFGKHIDRGSGFTHSAEGDCACLNPNAKEDTL